MSTCLSGAIISSLMGSGCTGGEILLQAAPAALKVATSDTSEGAPLAQSTNKVDQFLALRGVACLIVLLGHAYMLMRSVTNPIVIGGFDLTWLLRPNAAMGMYVFFTLSGYLMGNQFFAHRYSISKKGILGFFRARVMRIAPLYYALTIFYLIYDGVDFLRDFHPNQLLKILTFTFSIWPFDWSGEHFWSIATEMQFYLTVPALFLISKKFCKNGYLLALSLVGVIACVEFYRVQAFLKCVLPNGALDMVLYHKKIYYPLIGNFDAFFVGFWLNMFYEWLINSESEGHPTRVKKFFAQIVSRISAPQSAKSQLFNLGIAWTAIFVCYSIIAWLQQTDITELPALKNGTINLVTALGTAVFIIIARSAESHTKNVRLDISACLKNPFRLFECIGVLSYGIYLWHISIMVFLGAIITKANTLSEYAILVLSTTVVTIAFATVTYLGIEKPINQLRYKLAGSRDITSLF